MSAEIINLRQVRKQRAREQRAKEAAENRARFGVSKADREVEETSRTRAAQVLDGHFVSAPPPTNTAEHALDDADGSPRPAPKPKR